MKKTLFIILSFLQTLLVEGQDSLVPNGTIIGNQTAIPIPVGPSGAALGQALIYYPDDYFQAQNANKRYPLYVFLHGAGEGRYLNISEVTNTSLPYLIKGGLKPYGIDQLTGDTIKFIVISPHCARCNGSYSYPQLQYTIPYLFKAYRVDTSCVWVGGLSAGARGTWSVVMGGKVGDTALGKRITGIMPMANGGYDEYLSSLGPNLDTIARRGLGCLYVIGDQDPGYNSIGFFAYQAVMRKYSLPGRYFDSVIIGGTHSANVWNPPFLLTSRLWSKIMNAWTQMWSMRKKMDTSPIPNPLKARIWIDSLVIHYPNTSVQLADSSEGKHNFVSWGATNYPTGSPGRWAGGYTFYDMLYANLVEGAYKIQLVIGDNFGNTDTAFVNLRVYGPPICPVPRTLVGLEMTIINGALAWKLTYSDGFVEIKQQ